MKSYKKISIIILSGFFITGHVFASPDSHKKSANELLDTINVNELLEQTVESMLQLELSNNPALLPYEEVMRTFFLKHMSGESFRDEFATIYMQTFSEKEIIEINNFYKTETGQKTLKKAPELMAKGAAIGQERVQQNIPELQSMIAAEAQRIQELQQQ